MTTAEKGTTHAEDDRLPRFDTQGEDAANFYVSLFPSSTIDNVSHDDAAGPDPKAAS